MGPWDLKVEKCKAKYEGVNKVHHSQRINFSPESSLVQNFHQNWGFRLVPPTWKDAVDNFGIGCGVEGRGRYRNAGVGFK